MEPTYVQLVPALPTEKTAAVVGADAVGQSDLLPVGQTSPVPI